MTAQSWKTVFFRKIQLLMSYILSLRYFRVCAQASFDCYHQDLSFAKKIITLSEANRMQGQEMSLRYFVPGFSDIFAKKYQKGTDSMPKIRLRSYLDQY